MCVLTTLRDADCRCVVSLTCVADAAACAVNIYNTEFPVYLDRKRSWVRVRCIGHFCTPYSSLIARQRVPLHAQHWLRHNAPFHFRKRVILHRGLFVHSRTIHVRVLSCIYRMNFSERRARAREREKVSARVKMNRFAFEARSTRQPQFVCSRGILVTGFRRVIGPAFPCRLWAPAWVLTSTILR